MWINNDWKDVIVKMGTIGTVATNSASTRFLVNRRRTCWTLQTDKDKRKKEKNNRKS